MTNHIITTEEFNKKLFEALCTDVENTEEGELCLIDGDKIQEDHIKLACGHKFNYPSIFNELSNQKKYSSLETHRLKKYQTKCPYCRTIQNGVIPFNNAFPDLKEEGVNWPPSRVSKNEQCTAILKCGKRKGEKCDKPCFAKFCARHQMINQKTKQKIDATSNIIRCIAIIKSGKRKGSACNCKCKSPESQILKLCKRHSKNTI